MYAALACVVSDPPCRSNQTYTQLWRLLCTAQRHQGAGRWPGDSRTAVHTKCQSGHRYATSMSNFAALNQPPSLPS